MNRTYMAKQGEVARRWYVVDAKGKTLGRLASQIAYVLRGKHKPEFSPHVDTGDFVIVVNADQVRLTGKKWDDKIYYFQRSHRPGGLRRFTARQLHQRRPEMLIRQAVWGMLPHNRLGRKMFAKLKVYAGPDHPHSAQQPQTFPFPLG
ncbi:MAG: 50S ribosomal protein L13 [Firmicutes bacterium]|nr:50S ribosomal protein L13 [Bacillota bacterium]